jgi:hypothetical protein
MNTENEGPYLGHMSVCLDHFCKIVIGALVRRLTLPQQLYGLFYTCPRVLIAGGDTGIAVNTTNQYTEKCKGARTKLPLVLNHHRPILLAPRPRPDKCTCAHTTNMVNMVTWE